MITESCRLNPLSTCDFSRRLTTGHVDVSGRYWHAGTRYQTLSINDGVEVVEILPHRARAEFACHCVTQ